MQLASTGSRKLARSRTRDCRDAGPLHRRTREDGQIAQRIQENDPYKGSIGGPTAVQPHITGPSLASGPSTEAIEL